MSKKLSPRFEHHIFKSIVFALFILSLFNSGCKSDIPDQALVVGTKAPDFTLEAFAGGKTTLKDLRGRNIFLLFWSSSCSSCKETMLILDEIYRDKVKDGFNVIGINVYQKKVDIEKYSKELGITYPLLMDQKGAVAGLYEVYAIPVAYILDESGVVLFKHLGDLSKEQVQGLIKKFWE